MIRTISLTLLLWCYCLTAITQPTKDKLIPEDYLAALCDFQELLDQSPSQRDLREDLYFKLLGALEELAAYRAAFLKTEQLIDLFPTVYFHVTAQELISIANTTYRHPVEKMQQMLAFYDAYKVNREAWDRNLPARVEAHWQQHFKQAAKSNFATNVRATLMSGIEAHVDYDLPRALRYFYLNQNRGVGADVLYEDFKATDAIFNQAVARGNEDLKEVFWPDWTIDIGNWWYGNSTGESVKSKRNRAFLIAIPKCKTDLIQTDFDPRHPEYHYTADSFRICDPRSNANCTPELVFQTMLESAQFIVPTQIDWLSVIPCKNSLAGYAGRVVTTVDEVNRSVVNYTIQDQHLLHPGKVTRTVLAKADAVYVKTIGEGTGNFPRVNEFFSYPVWASVDMRLKERVKDKLADPGALCRPFCLAPQPKTNRQLLRRRGEAFCQPKTSLSLFLFDTSGSMGESGQSGGTKMHEAVQSALQTLNTIEDNSIQTGETPRVSILSFGGPCSPHSVRKHLDFSDDLAQARQVVRGILTPAGATPLPTAIEVAEAELLRTIDEHQVAEGKLIILSDGESTCGRIRPENVYAYDIKALKRAGSVVKTLQHPSAPARGGIRYYTVGFNISPGSPAERDLQYLASKSGGKYFNAQDQYQLIRAFEKFHKVYFPIEYPLLSGVEGTPPLFLQALRLVQSSTFLEAIPIWQEYLKQYPNDPAGLYNLAISYEGVDRYQSAVKYYRAYLATGDETKDQKDIEASIPNLLRDYDIQLAYHKKVLGNDLAYLEQYYNHLFNSADLPMAAEFFSFITEKYLYYQQLTDQLEIADPQIKLQAIGVADDLLFLAQTIERSPDRWTENAIAYMGPTILKLEELVQYVIN